jgi:glycosyltransferase involved in cell wall biosynthesis
MLVSIVTVCRNNEKTIARTIQSVNAQSHKDIQHIFIDGASTDSTVTIIERDSRTSHKCLLSEPDKGIYDAMNKGIALATGDIIGILNADDHYKHNDVLSKVVSTFAQSNAECVFGDVEFFHADRTDSIVRRYNSGRFSRRMLAFGFMPAHPATFFRRSVYQRLGSFKTNYKISADFEFIARAFKNGDTVYVYLKEPFVRMQTGGVSTRGIKSKILLNREILRALSENGIYSSPLHLAAKFPIRLLELLK